ncbi:PIN domain-containing protein [Candidatus Woesearchaeota archaeon]|nr:PIN domain-containing protein [Candidatus Woesearchaeota archaeon]
MKVTESKLIDSSVWLAYFFNGFYTEIIDSEEIFLLSVLSLFEIKNKLVKSNIEMLKIRKSIDLIKKKSLVINLNEETAEKAVEFSSKKGLAAIDSLIYTTAILNNAKLITMDNDFRNLDNVLILNKN